jgi:hypothetical protein
VASRKEMHGLPFRSQRSRASIAQIAETRTLARNSTQSPKGRAFHLSQNNGRNGQRYKSSLRRFNRMANQALRTAIATSPNYGAHLVSDTLTDQEKATFRAAGERRKAAGIRLRRIFILADANQVASFNTLWESWVDRWGKQKAVDELLRFMSLVEARLRDKERTK